MCTITLYLPVNMTPPVPVVPGTGVAPTRSVYLAAEGEPVRSHAVRESDFQERLTDIARMLRAWAFEHARHAAVSLVIANQELEMRKPLPPNSSLGTIESLLEQVVGKVDSPLDWQSSGASTTTASTGFLSAS